MTTGKQEELQEKEGHLLLKFRAREAPEGWWLFFEDMAPWGPFETRKECEDLATEMATFISKEFKLPIDERKTVKRLDKELMPWDKRKRTERWQPRRHR